MQPTLKALHLIWWKVFIIYDANIFFKLKIAKQRTVFGRRWVFLASFKRSNWSPRGVHHLWCAITWMEKFLDSFWCQIKSKYLQIECVWALLAPIRLRLQLAFLGNYIFVLKMHFVALMRKFATLIYYALCCLKALLLMLRMLNN